MKHKRVPHGVLQKIAPRLKVSPDNLSGILGGHRNISKPRSLFFEKISQELGYNFTATDWMFNPQKIKAALANNNNPPKTKEETA